MQDATSAASLGHNLSISFVICAIFYLCGCPVFSEYKGLLCVLFCCVASWYIYIPNWVNLVYIRRAWYILFVFGIFLTFGIYLIFFNPSSNSINDTRKVSFIHGINR